MRRRIGERGNKWNIMEKEMGIDLGEKVRRNGTEKKGIGHFLKRGGNPC
jgi:hypothetical protein